MEAPPLKVVLDANVLFPFSLRDTLLRAAAKDYFQIYWTEEILEEARRSLVGLGAITEEQADRLMTAMTEAFPEAMVSGYEPFIPSMHDEKDRHVAAAAVKVEARIIVTNNLKDFRKLPNGVEAQSPDEFLQSLFDLDAVGMVDLLRDQAASLRKPPRSFDELVNGLSKLVPGFARAVRDFTTL